MATIDSTNGAGGGVRLTAVRLEAVIVRRGRAAHRLDHLLAQLHRRRQRLRVTACSSESVFTRRVWFVASQYKGMRGCTEDKSKVDVEEVPPFREQEVVEVPVADAEQKAVISTPPQ